MKLSLATVVLLLVTTFGFSLDTAGGALDTSSGGSQLVTMLVTYCLILMPLGLIPAAIASRKGRSFARWWVYGWLLFLVAIVHSVSIKGRRCPYCAERIRPEAQVCRFCGRDLSPAQRPPQTQTPIA